MRTGRAALVLLTSTALFWAPRRRRAHRPRRSRCGPCRPHRAGPGGTVRRRPRGDHGGRTRHRGPRARRGGWRALAAPGRTFLDFDPRGRAVEVIGDLATATRVAVLVPGADTTLATFDSRGTGVARRRGRPSRRGPPRDPGPDWPSSPGSATTPRHAQPEVITRATPTRAQAAAAAGRVAGVARRPGRAAVPQLRLGGLRPGRAAQPGRSPTSRCSAAPGLDASSAAPLGTRARVWAGRGAGDWTAHVPHVRFLGLGLGPDPVGPTSARGSSPPGRRPQRLPAGRARRPCATSPDRSRRGRIVDVGPR